MSAGRFTSAVLWATTLAFLFGCDSGGSPSAAAGGFQVRHGNGVVEVATTDGALSLDVGAVRIGSTVLYDGAAQEPSETLPDGTVVYQRAPGLVERYVPRVIGVEQVWVFDESLEGHRNDGELRIRVALDSSLTPEEVEIDGRKGINFKDASGNPVIGYSAPIAFDAAGKAAELTYTLTDGRLDMVLGAAFLATAEFPLIVDPLVGSPITVDGAAADPYNLLVRPVDVAYNATAGEWATAWSDSYLLQGSRITTAGVVGGFTPGDAGGDDGLAAISWDPATARYLVVYPAPGPCA